MNEDINRISHRNIQNLEDGFLRVIGHLHHSGYQEIAEEFSQLLKGIEEKKAGPRDRPIEGWWREIGLQWRRELQEVIFLAEAHRVGNVGDSILEEEWLKFKAQSPYFKYEGENT